MRRPGRLAVEVLVLTLEARALSLDVRELTLDVRGLAFASHTLRELLTNS